MQYHYIKRKARQGKAFGQLSETTMTNLPDDFGKS
jgi:hypothetical protein